MVKLTSAQIDARIIDRAAGLFAAHGLQHTSVQQIADATGYSKAGILRRFATKDALFAGALAAARASAVEVADRVEGIAPGPERDRAAIEQLVDLTYRWPGVSSLLNRIAELEEQAEGSADLMIAADAVLRAFAMDADVDEQRQVRLISSTAGLTLAALAAVRVGQTERWRAVIVAAAYDALGH